MRPKIDNIRNIANVIKNEFKDDDLSTVNVMITVDDGHLKKLNEELFYRYSEGGQLNESDTVVLNVDGINFHFAEVDKEMED